MVFFAYQATNFYNLRKRLMLHMEKRQKTAKITQSNEFKLFIQRQRNRNQNQCRQITNNWALNLFRAQNKETADRRSWWKKKGKTIIAGICAHTRSRQQAGMYWCSRNRPNLKILTLFCIMAQPQTMFLWGHNFIVFFFLIYK